MLYSVYKTTCIPTGQHYYGVHKTKDVEERFLGEGVKLLELIELHSKSAFTVEVLNVFPYSLRSQAFKQLRALIALNDPLCLNIQKGESGFARLSAKGLNTKNEPWKKAIAKRTEMSQTDPEYNERRSKAISDGQKNSEKFKAARANTIGKPRPGAGSYGPRKAEAIEKMKATFAKKRKLKGWRWMHNLELGLSRVILRDDIQEYKKNGWVFGRRKDLKRD